MGAIVYLASPAGTLLRWIFPFPLLLGDGGSEYSGLAHLFSGYADKKTVRICCGCYLAFAGGLLIWRFWWAGVAVLIGISLIFIVFWHLCKKQFGGITGDLAGFFLQMTELAVLAVCTFGGMLEW